MMMPRIIAAIRFYVDSPEVYASDDIESCLPFRDEGSFQEYFRQRGIPIDKERVYEAKLDGVTVQVYQLRSQPRSERRRYEDGFPFSDIQIGRGVYERVVSEEMKRREAKRKKQGYVNYSVLISDDETRGSLSFLITPRVQEMIYSPEMVQGYLGHAGRKHHMDEYIEYTVMRVLDYTRKRGISLNLIDMVSSWLCSSDARIWMDKAAGCNKTEFKRLYKAKLISMIGVNSGGLRISEEELRRLEKFLG